MKRNMDWLSGDIGVIPSCLLSLGKPEKIEMIEWFEYLNFLFWISPGDPTPPLPCGADCTWKTCLTVHRKTKKSYCYVTFGIRIFESMSWDDGLWLSAIRPKPFVLCLRLFKTINGNLCLWLTDLFLMVAWERCLYASMRKIFLKATRIWFVRWIRVNFLIQGFLWNLLRTVAYC